MKKINITPQIIYLCIQALLLNCSNPQQTMKVHELKDGILKYNQTFDTGNTDNLKLALNRGLYAKGTFTIKKATCNIDEKKINVELNRDSFSNLYSSNHVNDVYSINFIYTDRPILTSNDSDNNFNFGILEDVEFFDKSSQTWIRGIVIGFKESYDENYNTVVKYDILKTDTNKIYELNAKDIRKHTVCGYYADANTYQGKILKIHEPKLHENENPSYVLENKYDPQSNLNNVIFERKECEFGLNEKIIYKKSGQWVEAQLLGYATNPTKESKYNSTFKYYIREDNNLKIVSRDKISKLAIPLPKKNKNENDNIKEVSLYDSIKVSSKNEFENIFTNDTKSYTHYRRASLHPIYFQQIKDCYKPLVIKSEVILSNFNKKINTVKKARKYMKKDLFELSYMYINSFYHLKKSNRKGAEWSYIKKSMRFLYDNMIMIAQSDNKEFFFIKSSSYNDNDILQDDGNIQIKDAFLQADFSDNIKICCEGNYFFNQIEYKYMEILWSQNKRDYIAVLKRGNSKTEQYLFRPHLEAAYVTRNFMSEQDDMIIEKLLYLCEKEENRRCNDGRYRINNLINILLAHIDQNIEKCYCVYEKALNEFIPFVKEHYNNIEYKKNFEEKIDNFNSHKNIYQQIKSELNEYKRGIPYITALYTRYWARYLHTKQSWAHDIEKIIIKYIDFI